MFKIFFPLLFLFHPVKEHAQSFNNQTLMFKPMEIKDSSSRFFSLNIIKPNYYANHLGFFCKEEIKRDKKIGLPIRFRLGSMDYCDKLEGKTKQ